jgi:hypothetical protein
MVLRVWLTDVILQSSVGSWITITTLDLVLVCQLYIRNTVVLELESKGNTICTGMDLSMQIFLANTIERMVVHRPIRLSVLI